MTRSNRPGTAGAAARNSSSKGSFAAAVDAAAADDSDLSSAQSLRQCITAPSLVAPGSLGVPAEELVEVPLLTLKDTLLRSMPIWLTVLILLITRVPQMKVKDLVTR
jgi:hypothetical protein